jgi:hypothetical protein
VKVTGASGTRSKQGKSTFAAKLDTVTQHAALECP